MKIRNATEKDLTELPETAILAMETAIQRLLKTGANFKAMRLKSVKSLFSAVCSNFQNRRGRNFRQAV